MSTRLRVLWLELTTLWVLWPATLVLALLGAAAVALAAGLTWGAWWLALHVDWGLAFWGALGYAMLAYSVLCIVVGTAYAVRLWWRTRNPLGLMLVAWVSVWLAMTLLASIT